MKSNYGKILRRLRHLRGLTLNELGVAMGLSYQQIQKYETGKNGIPLKRLTEFAEVLEVGINAFFDDCEDYPIVQKQVEERCR